MEYLSIKQSYHENNLADALVMREQELYQYDLNITNYTAMLESLPSGEWPEHLAQYRGKTLDQVPDELDAEVDALNYRDRLRFLLKTEKAERNKSALVYQTLLAQMPKDKVKLQEAVDAAALRIKG
jgi:hypothetical protein